VIRHRGGILAVVILAVNATACPPPSRVGPDRDPVPRASSPVASGRAALAESLAPEPAALWSRRVGRAVRGTPALGQQVIAVGAVDRTVVLLDRDTGVMLWRARLSGTVRGGPLLRDDRIYVATERTPTSHVYALNLRDGKTAWRRRAGSVSASLALDGDALYAATEEGTALRLAARDGAVVWRRSLGGGIRAAPLPTAAGVAIATTADSVFLLDGATGEVRARRATPGAVLATPVADRDRLYAATVRGVVLAMTLARLEPVWEIALPDAVYGAPVLAGDTLVVLSRDGTLALIPLAAPEARRTVPLGRTAVAGPTVTRSGILIGTVAGEVLRVDPATGAVRWQTRVAGPIESAPLVRDGQIVVVGGRGDVHLYQ
jgi:outer membrane protein assembly factor BamB